MQLALVGTGLMGGSFALAARSAGLFSRVVGIEPDAERLEQALSLGVVDTAAADVPAEADAVLLAGPSDTVAPWVVRLAGHGGILFDTASVKGAVLAEIRARAGAVPARFVPCHPITGSERNGPAAADAALYRDAEVIVTPTDSTDADALEQVQDWWRRVGARVCTMSGDAHDRVLARTSHLPHLLACAYLRLIEPEHLPHTGGGFRDFTRIGAAGAGVWGPILRLNRGAVLEVLDELEAELARARELIRGEDREALTAFLEDAAVRRQGPTAPGTRGG